MNYQIMQEFVVTQKWEKKKEELMKRFVELWSEHNFTCMETDYILKIYEIYYRRNFMGPTLLFCRFPIHDHDFIFVLQELDDQILDYIYLFGDIKLLLPRHILDYLIYKRQWSDENIRIRVINKLINVIISERTILNFFHNSYTYLLEQPREVIDLTKFERFSNPSHPRIINLV